MINSNATVLRWNASLNMAEYQRGYDMGSRLGALPVEVNQVPPFQLPRAKTGAAITLFKLVHFATGTETDVTTEIASSGLAVGTYAAKNYDLIKYPSSAAIAGVGTLPIGSYYAIMSDGTNTWYSELFCMVASVAEMVKIEWCHQEDFLYPGGHIDYANNYSNYLYFKSDILAPSYEYDEEVKERDGYKFFEKQTSFKLSKMQGFLSEAVIDAFRLARLHDNVTITNNNDGRVYTVDEILLTDIEWQNMSHLAHLAIEFKTDTVVTINGKAVFDAECGSGGATETGPAPCVDVDFECVAAIDEGSAAYTGKYYVPSGGGANVPFVENDYILIKPTGFDYHALYQFVSNTYVLVADQLEDVIAFNANDSKYHWQNVVPSGNVFLEPEITGIYTTPGAGTWTAYGVVMGGVSIELFTVDAMGNETLAGVGDQADFETTGLTFDWIASAVGAKIKISTPTCNRYYESPVSYFEGVNYWIIEDDNEVQ